MDFLDELNGFFRRIQLDVEGRRREDRALNSFSGIVDNKILFIAFQLAVAANISLCRVRTVLSAPKPSKNILVIDKVYFYAKNNAIEHHTVRYELVHRQPETAVFRRGQPFTFIIRFADGKSFSPGKDILRLHFNLGELFPPFPS